MPTHKILVIDDSKVIRMRVKDMLPVGNFEVIEAKDGLEGYNLIRSENPNLIMLDFLLPKMSGWEVYQEIQKQQHLRNIPLVLMSGRKEEVTDKLPEPFEYFSFVEKPFDQKQLVDAIREAMMKAKKQPQHFDSSDHKTTGVVNTDTVSMAAEIESLKTQIKKMDLEMEQLKKQVNQLINYIRQKVK
ncbi:response regulator receiver protein [Stanieria cyanosphaera PCC 7437]|uniref:Response regulator receiver protein n=1 Tax=Stanieria cyanosphaera (strain ATCC 29371 / PCC 7437) TaxID=111780 RepID=K9XT04_STAC7|nr:response regulator [Stanieria cyanosphaera]AFZ35735.1 response regulator receiver protein [Stanieria cyanosphaera PCC 7437]